MFKFLLLFNSYFLLSITLSAQQKTNIIIIVADDLGWGDVGFNGCKDIPTPHLDELARNGVSFSAGYAAHPYCSPSRAGLITGKHQQRFGHENNTPYNQEDPDAGVPLTEKMLSEVLKANQYNTCAIGKWHLGDAQKFWPTNRGFDQWYGFFGGGMSYWGDTGKKGAMHGVLRNGVPVPMAEQTYLTDDFTKEAIQFIEQQKSNPFFLYLAYNAPHGPIHATSEYLSKTDHIEDGARSAYAAMVVGMDEGIGKVIQSLKSQNLYENTLIVFYSDNGGHINGANSMPFRGHKGMLFEGGIRVPFLVSWPKGIKHPHRYPNAVTALDIFPTALAAAGIEQEKELSLDGVNLLPYLSGHHQGAPHQTLYWRYSDGMGYAVLKDNFKMIRSGYKNDFLLFDLEKDPYEQSNLAKTRPDKLEELIQLYQKWDKTLIPAKWYDPHPENVLKEENKRLEIRRKAAKGEKPIKK